VFASCLPLFWFIPVAACADGFCLPSADESLSTLALQASSDAHIGTLKHKKEQSQRNNSGSLCHGSNQCEAASLLAVFTTTTLEAWHFWLARCPPVIAGVTAL
jgi:hypothetical protein